MPEPGTPVWYYHDPYTTGEPIKVWGWVASAYDEFNIRFVGVDATGSGVIADADSRLAPGSYGWELRTAGLE